MPRDIGLVADLGTLPSIGFSRQSFVNIENFLADIEGYSAKARAGTDILVRMMILVTKGYAQKKSGGPIAPRRRSNPALAARIPVQRITGRYFAGWTEKRVGWGHYVLYNDAVEAYLIETGLYQRVRRPILKMAFINMLRMVQTTRTGDAFLESVLAPRRNAKGQFQSFGTRLMGTQTLGGLAGPQGSLPG